VPAWGNALVQGDPEGLPRGDPPDLADELHPDPGAFGPGGGRRGRRGAGGDEGAGEDQEGAAEAHCRADYPIRRSQGLPGYLTRGPGYDV